MLAVGAGGGILKKNCQTDKYLVSLCSETSVFEDKMTKYLSV